MEDIVRLLIGVLFLILGIPIGNFLARVTKDEFKQGQKWFRLIIVVCLIGGIVSLLIGNDVLLFTFFFIAIVTSRNLKKN